MTTIDRTLRILTLTTTLLLLFLPPPLASAATRYVDVYATGAANGTAWANAYTNLRDALTAAIPGDDLWVAQGSYSPDPAIATLSFNLKPDVGLYGGFAGNETTLDQRDWRRHPTLLEGDIATPGNVRDNTRQLVIANGATNAVLDGFDIHNANATTNHVLGGGSLPGGGLAITGAPIAVRHCRFIANQANEGAAVYTTTGSTFLNCLFSGNAATANAGAVMSRFGSPVFDNCVFHDNSCGTGSGGAIAMAEQTLTMRHCTVVSNRASFAGYNIYIYNQATAHIRNAIFWNEDHPSRDYGGGICVRQFGSDTNLHAKLVDVRNTTVKYGFTPPLYGASTNILTADPLFVNDGTRDLHLQPASPCVDAGDLADAVSPDLDGITRPVGAGVDLGAYEYTAAVPPTPAPVTGAAATGAIARVTLSWTNAASSEFRGVLIVRRLSSQTAFGLPGNGGSYTAGDHVGNGTVVHMGTASSPTPGALATFTTTNLPPATDYTFQVYAFDTLTNYASPVAASALTAPPPPPVVGGSTQDGQNQVELQWTNPSGSETQGVLVMRRRNAIPTNPPQHTVAYQAGETLGTSDIVYVGLGTNPTPGVQSGWIDSPLPNNATYVYRLYAFDTGPSYSAPSSSLVGRTFTIQSVSDVITNVSAHGVSATWTNPDNAAFAGVVVLRATDEPPQDVPDNNLPLFVGDEVGLARVVYSGPGLDATPGATSGWTEVELLATETTYYYAFMAFDNAYNYADLVHAEVTTLADVEAPAPITDLTATVTGLSEVTLDWTNPTTLDFAGVLIVRKVGNPLPWVPEPFTAYPVNTSTPAGIVVYAGPAAGSTPGATNGFVDTVDLYPGSTVSYSVYAMDQEPIYATGAVAPATLPPLTVLYVNQAATGLNNGTSWANAFTSLQSALTAATSNNAIWVARGVYKPTTTANRSAVFILKANVPLYGGFAGTETSARQRRWGEFETILSGNIGNTATRFDNSERLVLAPASAAGALLDGFILEDAHGPLHPGAGLRVDAPITVQNCVFRNHEADGGGAVFNQHDAIFRNCRFTQNTSRSNGGAVQSDNANPRFINCLFDQNTCDLSGGAMSVSQQVVTVEHCTFADNEALQGGGAVYAASFVTATFVNCILADDGDDGGGILVERPGEGTEATLVAVRYSVVNGEFLDSDESSAFMNIIADPLFVDAPNGDYHLQAASPAIDAGTALAVTTIDLDHRGRPAGTGYDMGAYEFGSIPPFTATGALLLQVR